MISPRIIRSMNFDAEDASQGVVELLSADIDRSNFPFTIEDEIQRQGFYLIRLRNSTTPYRTGWDLRPCDLVILQESFKPFFPFFIVFHEDDAQDLQPLTVELRIHTAVVLEIPDAAPSPGAPEIEEHDLAS